MNRMLTMFNGNKFQTGFNPDFTFKDAIKLLRIHNQTGKPIVSLTDGDMYERPLMTDFLNECENLLIENALLKRRLKIILEEHPEVEESMRKKPIWTDEK